MPSYESVSTAMKVNTPYLVRVPLTAAPYPIRGLGVAVAFRLSFRASASLCASKPFMPSGRKMNRPA